MTKLVLLQSVVPSTYDAGFKASGYKVVELVETDEPVDLKAGILERAVAEIAKGVAIRRIISNTAPAAPVAKPAKVK